MTIVDIAEKSGYSVTTVSRVLNNRRDVSPKARKRIGEIVDKYNFVPNNNAKYLKQSVSKMIMVLVKGISNMFFADLMEELQSQVEKTEYSIVSVYLEEEQDEVMEAVRLYRERKPAGILFLGGNPENFRDAFQEITIPCVLVTNQGKSLDFTNLSSVTTDDFIAAEKAVDLLFFYGHEKIAVLGGDIDCSYTSRQRFLGCANSFRKHGREFDADRYFKKVRYDFSSAYNGMEELLNGKEAFTAVFAMSDVMAIGAMRAACDRGLLIPDDISFVGFDGTRLAEYYNPKLVTVRQRYKVIADRSLEILLSAFGLKQEAVHEIVPFEIASGESIKRI